MTPDEIRAMNNDYAIVFIRGEAPVMDHKYDILKHPQLKYTEDGGAEPYIHKPGLDFSMDDLGFSVDSLDDIEIIDETEIA